LDKKTLAGGKGVQFNRYGSFTGSHLPSTRYVLVLVEVVDLAGRQMLPPYSYGIAPDSVDETHLTGFAFKPSHPGDWAPQARIFN